jgi:hypothetical protein
MLDAAHLRAKAVEYRASAENASDSKTQDLYLSVAKYLDAWADEVEAMEASYAASRPPPFDRQAG